ncbi:hypothetical protein Tco_0670483 [Tanacetum coccineum]
MAALKFASSHNMVAFLDKPTESDGFEQIVDFLNAHPIKYVLMVNPIIYTACIEQFWTTAKVQTVNGEVQIQALVDKKMVIITETSIRRDLKIADENGTECLPNATIFAELERMGSSTINQPSSSQLPKKQKPRKSKKHNTEAPSRGVTNLMFDTGVLDNEQDMAEKEVDMAEKDVSTADPVTTASEVVTTTNVVVSTAKVTTDNTTTTTIDELTLAQTLIQIKAAKPKAVTTAATTTTTVVTRPKARGVVVQEPSKFTSTTSQPSQLPQAKDKGKEKMIELEKPLKRKIKFWWMKKLLKDFKKNCKLN